MYTKNNISRLRSKAKYVKTAKGRKVGSTHWIKRHINDDYVLLAKKEGYRSRAAYKLLEINDKFNILQHAKCIIDLGCAPGSWLQVLKRHSRADNIIGIDLKQVEELQSVNLIQGDFNDDNIKQEILNLTLGTKPDLILSDMAPNACGQKDVDHIRIMSLVEQVIEFSIKNLNKGGIVVSKILRGRNDNDILTIAKHHFKSVKFFKPNSSYSDSSEIFIIAMDLL